GSSQIGGVIGGSGTGTNSYFDKQTTRQTGQGPGVCFACGTALTTAELQSRSASGLGAPLGGGRNGLHPFLTYFHPNGVQAISGFAYQASGPALASTGSAPVVVSAVVNGQSAGSATSGANGYYYIAAPNGSIGNGAGVLATMPVNGNAAR